MKHINALLNPTQSRNLQKVLDLAIWEVAGNKNKDKYLFTVEDIEEAAVAFMQFLGEVKAKEPFLLLNHFIRQ